MDQLEELTRNLQLTISAIVDIQVRRATQQRLEQIASESEQNACQNVRERDNDTDDTSSRESETSARKSENKVTTSVNDTEQEATLSFILRAKETESDTGSDSTQNKYKRYTSTDENNTRHVISKPQVTAKTPRAQSSTDSEINVEIAAGTRSITARESNVHTEKSVNSNAQEKDVRTSATQTVDKEVQVNEWQFVTKPSKARNNVIKKLREYSAEQRRREELIQKELGTPKESSKEWYEQQLEERRKSIRLNLDYALARQLQREKEARQRKIREQVEKLAKEKIAEEQRKLEHNQRCQDSVEMKNEIQRQLALMNKVLLDEAQRQFNAQKEREKKVLAHKEEIEKAYEEECSRRTADYNRIREERRINNLKSYGPRKSTGTIRKRLLGDNEDPGKFYKAGESETDSSEQDFRPSRRNASTPLVSDTDDSEREKMIPTSERQSVRREAAVNRPTHAEARPATMTRATTTTQEEIPAGQEKKPTPATSNSTQETSRPRMMETRIGDRIIQHPEGYVIEANKLKGVEGISQYQREKIETAEKYVTGARREAWKKKLLTGEWKANSTFQDRLLREAQEEQRQEEKKEQEKRKAEKK